MLSAGEFSPLHDIFQRFSDQGRVATLWWRDDDATVPGVALDRLLGLSAAHAVPLALAVVPAGASEALADRLAAEPTALCVLQHGYAHQNHAGTGEKKIELGPQRPAQVTIGELATGWLRLESLFGARALPILVPPWNRLAPFLVPVLPELGYRGLSQYGPRARVVPVKQLRQVNCHVDPIDWRGTRGFVGAGAAVAALAGHLRLRLEAPAGSAAAEEPTGLMTHHAVHGPELWAFLDRLLAAVAGNAAARWLDARTAFLA